MLKKALRKEFLSKRKSLTDEELAKLSQKICDNFFAFFSVNSYKTIHIFLPIKKQNEIDTWLIINQLRNIFPKTMIVLPRISEDEKMENYLFDEETILEENHLKIQEPIQNQKSKIQNPTIDLVFLPLLIFDKNGNRVGYGKGFYDKFLATCRPDSFENRLVGF